MLGNKTAFKSLNFLNADFWVLMDFDILGVLSGGPHPLRAGTHGPGGGHPGGGPGPGAGHVHAPVPGPDGAPAVRAAGRHGLPAGALAAGPVSALRGRPALHRPQHPGRDGRLHLRQQGDGEPHPQRLRPPGLGGAGLPGGAPAAAGGTAGPVPELSILGRNACMEQSFYAEGMGS